MIDRCVLTTTDIIIGNAVLWSLYFADFIFTYKNIALARKWKPRKYLEFEMNVLYRFFIGRHGLRRGMFMAFPIITAAFMLLLVLFPFVTSLAIGYLFCMLVAVHIPNYRDLRKRVQNARPR